MSLAWRQYLSTIIDLVIPARCLGCQKKSHYLCPDCLALIPPADPLELPNTEAIFHYRDPRIRQAIWRLKYRGGQVIARDLARALHERWLESMAEWRAWHPSEASQWLVAPIPLTRARERARGFNQARVLARELVKLNENNLTLGEKILIKNKETVSQMKIRYRQVRLKNLRGTLAVPENKRPEIAGKNILLIDDVITTGATMQEARRALRAAGAGEIFGLAVAHG